MAAGAGERSWPGAAGERVTVLLTDVEGSTPMWEREPDRMYEAMLRHEAIIGAAVADHGGQLLHTRGEGDSTFSIFPRTEDALQAAVRVQEDLTREPWTTATPLKVRMAVNVGVVAQRSEADYYGPEINRTARIRSAARGGEVLLSDATAAVLLDRPDLPFRCVSFGLHELRGLEQPEHIHRLVLPGEPADGSTGRARPDLHRALAEASPIVGRDDALATLEAARTAAAGGATRFVLVGGEPGIGKTSLVAAAARSAHALGETVLLARCEQDGSSLSQVVADLLRPFVAVTSLDDLRSLPAASWLARLLPELGAAGSGTTPAEIAPEDERAALFDAVVEAFALARRRGPVLVVIDDLQWADPALLLLLRRLTRDERVRGLLVVATCREGATDLPSSVAALFGDLRRDEVFERIGLDGLAPGDVERLVDLVAAGSDVGSRASLALALRDAAAGNPLFMVEILRTLGRGNEPAPAGPWTADELVAQVGVPDGVRDVIGGRLDPLSSTAQATIGLVAVLGERVRVAHLLDVARRAGPKDVLDGVEELVEADLLVDRDGSYEFPHALVRETVLAGYSDTRRMRLHLEVATALEELERTEPEELARHLLAAGPVADAAEVGRRVFEAGLAAADGLAFEAALEWFARAEAALADQGSSAAALRAVIAIEEGWVLSYLSRLDERRATFYRAVEHALVAGSPTLVRDAVAPGAFANELGERDDRWAEQCLRAVDRLPEGDPIRLLLEAMAAQHALVDGIDDDVEGRARRAADAARAEGDLVTLHHALRVLASVLLSQPRYDDLLALADELASMPQPRDAIRVGVDFVHPLLLRGVATLSRGDLVGFDQVTEEMAAMAPARPWGQTFTHHTWRTVRAMLAGRWAEAEGHLDQLIAASDRPNAQASWAANQVSLARERGGSEAFIPFVEQAIVDSPGISAYPAARALLLAENGRHDEARPLFDAALAGHARMPIDGLWVMSLALLAQTAVLLGLPDVAPRLYEQILPWSGGLLAQAGASFHLGAADRILGSLAALAGRPDDADRHLADALRFERGLDARPCVVRTQIAMARARALRGEPADPALLALLEEAAAEAGELGMLDHLAHIRELQAAAAGAA